MACSNCHESDHNVRTCTKKVVANTNTTNASIRSQTQTSPPKELGSGGVQIEKQATNKSSIRSQKIPVINTTLTPNMQKVLDRLNDKAKAGGGLLNNEIRKRDFHIQSQISKLPQGPSPPLAEVTTLKPPVPLNHQVTPKETENNVCPGCNNHEHSEEGKCNEGRIRCGYCKQPHHNIKTCPQLEGQREEVRQRNSQGPAWATDDVIKRLHRGPPEKDGRGWIYIYTFHTPRNPEESFMFKIGETMQEHPSRRVRVQESKNHETYQIIFSGETDWRKWAEGLIHLQLKDWRCPRPEGDGRTEWFKGERELFLRTVKDVLKEVRLSEWVFNYVP